MRPTSLPTAKLTATAALPSHGARRVRLEELDGIRGWAALCVVVFHLTWETFGAIVPALRNPVTGFLLDGGVAVAVFFALSGEALSAGFFAGGGSGAVLRLAVKRYTRLTIPIVAACALTLGLYYAGLVFNVQAAHYVHREDWLGSFIDPPPSLLLSLRYMLLTVYTSVAPQHAVIPFLWTMKFEMVGSIMVFATLLGVARLRGAWRRGLWIFVGLLFVSFITTKTGQWLSCFLAGIGFGWLRSQGFFQRMQASRRAQLWSWMLIALIGVLDGWSHWRVVDRRMVPLASVLLLGAVFCNRPLCAAFSGRLSRQLGRLSFPLYLIQFPVLVSVTSYAICFAAARGALHGWALAVIDVVSLCACLALAWAFLPVEHLTRRVGNVLAAHLLAPAAAAAPSRSPAAAPVIAGTVPPVRTASAAAAAADERGEPQISAAVRSG
ncbi:MAG TPA: acyltransferase [Steroidobacteraceae bacterium]|nr:acyltransferase [Steroidobacteraceae bacterium]